MRAALEIGSKVKVTGDSAIWTVVSITRQHVQVEKPVMFLGKPNKETRFILPVDAIGTDEIKQVIK